MDNFKSRYASKDADLYGADIFKGLEELNKKRRSKINPSFDEEIKRLTEAVYANKENLNWDDIAVLQELSTKIYKIR